MPIDLFFLAGPFLSPTVEPSSSKTPANGPYCIASVCDPEMSSDQKGFAIRSSLFFYGVRFR